MCVCQDGELAWRSPPSRQLSREKRIEYESDIRERFYDDYLGGRTSKAHTSTAVLCKSFTQGTVFTILHNIFCCIAGDARNEVMTTSELSKLKFDPTIYRANALQGLVYDPASELTNLSLVATWVYIEIAIWL